MDRAARLARIYDTIRDIPKGKVASYGQIAEIAGIPRGARHVGWALRQLPAGHDVPWYRVITSSGRIAFESGTPQFKEQRKAADERQRARYRRTSRHAEIPLAA